MRHASLRFDPSKSHERGVAALFECLADALQSETSTAYRRCGAALLIFFAAVAAASCALGAGPIAGPWDMAVLLDGGWRIVHGQVPHADFHNPIGALSYLLVAIGMRIAPASVSSIVYGNVILLAIVAPAAWRIARTRLPAAAALVLTLFVGVLLISPRPLGYGVRETTYAMIYNRQSYALTAVALVYAFVRPRNAARSTPIADDLLVGALLGLVLYCKITYFVLAAASLAVAFAVGARPLRRMIGCAAGLLGICLLFRAAFHLSLWDYLADISAAGAAQSAGMRLTLLARSLSDNSTWLFLLTVTLGLWTWSGRRTAPQFAARRAWCTAAWIVGIALLISSGNAAQGGGIDDPLFLVASIVAIELLRRETPDQIATADSPMRFAHTAVWVLLVPIFCGAILLRDLASLAYTGLWDLRDRPAYAVSRRLHSPRLQDFFVPESTQHITAYWPAREYPARINDGIDLLRSRLLPGDRVTTLGFANPFSFALGLQPARDALLWWDLDFSFDLRHHPPADQVLADASLVIVPSTSERGRGWSFETIDALLALYGPYLHSHFREVGSSATWTLYRRAAR